MNSKPTSPDSRRPRLWRKRYVLPAEHGLWTWWSVPLLIGLAASSCPRWDAVVLVVAALASFFLHQPAAIAVKAASGRRSRSDFRPALFWIGVDAVVTLAAVAYLLSVGHKRFIWLVVVGLPFFAWHLLLVYRGTERRQMAVEIVGAAVLALWAPAAYWVGGGARYPEPWILWVLTWSHSTAAITNVYLRLAQRRWQDKGTIGARLRAGRRTLGYHAAGLGLALLFAAAGLAPWLVALAFALVLADALAGSLDPAIGARPSRIGMRQLAATTAFLAVMLIAYLTR